MIVNPANATPIPGKLLGKCFRCSPLDFVEVEEIVLGYFSSRLDEIRS